MTQVHSWTISVEIFTGLESEWTFFLIRDLFKQVNPSYICADSQSVVFFVSWTRFLLQRGGIYSSWQRKLPWNPPYAFNHFRFAPNTMGGGRTGGLHHYFFFIISTFSNSLSHLSLTITLPDEPYIQLGPTKQKCRACKKGLSKSATVLSAITTEMLTGEFCLNVPETSGVTFG